MPFETHTEIHRKGYCQCRTCVESNNSRAIPSCSVDALLRDRPTNTEPSTLSVNNQGPDDGPRLVKVGCLRAVRRYVSNCTYNCCSKVGYHNLPGLCEVRHLCEKASKRGPVRIVTAVLLKCCDCETIDFLRVSFTELSKYHR